MSIHYLNLALPYFKDISAKHLELSQTAQCIAAVSELCAKGCPDEGSEILQVVLSSFKEDKRLYVYDIYIWIWF